MFDEEHIKSLWSHVMITGIILEITTITKYYYYYYYY